MEIGNRLSSVRFPADALYLDIDLVVRNRPLTVDYKAFRVLPQALTSLHYMHFHVIAITDPAYRRCSQSEAYPPYDLVCC